jgi:putative transposase
MYARGVYHVAGHASGERSLFVDDIDRHFFLDHLAETVALLGLRVISYVLMTNHHHLLIETPDGRIASALRRLHGGYARAHNIRHKRTAHLFRAHPLARRIEDNDDLVGTDRYLAWNPVAAGLILDPFDWFWSSARAHAGLAEPRFPLHDAPLRGAYENPPNWRDHYRAYVSGGRDRERFDR